MGKKRVVVKTKEEVIKETEKREAIIQKVTGKTPKKKKIVEKGRAYIYSTYNNTMITITDRNGNVLACASSGMVGFKGPQKSTPFAASKVAEVVAEKAERIGMKEIEVLVKGIGTGRDSAIRSLGNKGLEIVSIKDITPIPHNGCRPRKPRRV